MSQWIGPQPAANSFPVVIATDSLPIQTVSGDEVLQTYSAAVQNFTPGASPTDVFCIFGSATKKIRVLRLGISGVAGALGVFSYQLIKRSTANTLGSSTVLTGVPHDSGDGSATAVVTAYTANPTTGAVVGPIRSNFLTTTTNSNVSVSETWQFGDIPDKAVVLNNASEGLCWNFNGNSLGNNTKLNFFIEWTEK